MRTTSRREPGRTHEGLSKREMAARLPGHSGQAERSIKHSAFPCGPAAEARLVWRKAERTPICMAWKPMAALLPEEGTR